MESGNKEVEQILTNHRNKSALVLTPTDDGRKILTIETIKIKGTSLVKISRDNYEFIFSVVARATKEGRKFVPTYAGPPKDLKVVSKKIFFREQPLTILGEDRKLYLLTEEEIK